MVWEGVCQGSRTARLGRLCVKGLNGQVREVMCQGTQRPGNEGGVL